MLESPSRHHVASSNLSNCQQHPKHTSTTLPEELMNLIVGNLDKASLATCSSLSHCWRASSLPVLFHSLTLGRCDPQNTHATCRLYGCNNYIHAFYAFLSSKASTNVKFHIKNLTLDGSLPCCSPIILTAFELDLILAKLPVLETLELREVSIERQCSMISPFGWKSPRPLKTLRLRKVVVYPPPWVEKAVPTMKERGAAKPECAFVEVLNLFSTIQTLDIQGSHFDWWGVGTDYGFYWDHDDFATEAASTLAPTSRVHELSFTVLESTEGYVDLLELLRRSHSLDELDRLTLGHEQVVSKRMLESTGQRLHSLCLDVYPDSNYNLRKDVYGLSFCTALTTLVVNVNVMSTTSKKTAGDTKTTYGHLHNILTHAPSSLLHLTLILEVSDISSSSDVSYVKHPFWKWFNTSYSSRPELKEITIKLKVDDEDDSPDDIHSSFNAAIDAIKKQMPRIMTTGLATFNTERPTALRAE